MVQSLWEPGATERRAALDVPGLEITLAGGRPGAFAAHRAGTNRWWASVGPAARAADDLARGGSPALPSRVLDEVSTAAIGDLVQLSIELDVCGAWLTVANAGACRPVAVRRAGWVDLRGHPAPALAATGHRYADDRVGLGPGDSLVLIPGDLRRRAVADTPGGTHLGDDDRLLDLLLVGSAMGGTVDSALTADALASTFGLPLDQSTPVVVVRVPDDLGDDRHGHLAAALGVARHELELPGYPLGDLQPDLWSRPPTPPRTARLHLPSSLTKVKEVRGLLSRMLASWRIADRVAADDVGLLASEVVTNAVRHSGTDAAVTMRYTGPTVEISVRDGCTREPAVLPPDPTRVGGRGMHLVDTLSSAWGTISIADGKVVWFEVPVAAGPIS